MSIIVLIVLVVFLGIGLAASKKIDEWGRRPWK